MWVYFSLCKSLWDLLDLFSSQLGLSELKQVLVSFLWKGWQQLSLIRYVSPFLVECCNRFETETVMNWKGPLPLLSPWLERGCWGLRHVQERGRAQVWARGPGLASFVLSTAPGTWELGSTCPSRWPSQVLLWGCRPSVAKSSDVQRRCQNRCLYVKSHSSTTFIFASCGGEWNKHVHGPDWLTSL